MSSNFDITKYSKIEDILFLDEPILTHLTRRNKNYLLYLVDTLDASDIYLMFEVEEETIIEYLTKRISLKNIIVNNDDNIFVIEQDFHGKVINTEVTQSENISIEYLPDEESFLEYIPSESSYYYNLIELYNEHKYLLSLRDKAFYIKFSPINTRYQHTLGLNELANSLLKNISSSFRSFVKADFFLKFNNSVSDKKRLSKAFSDLLPDLDFRMVDLKYGSFEIGLAVDTVMKQSIEDPNFRKWAVEVGDKYKNLVLDEDYDDETVKEIIDSYTEEDRKKIFNPIFQITESENFKLEIKDSKRTEYSTIQINDKEVISKIVPKHLIVEELPEKEYEIIQVTTVREKNKVSKSIKLDDNTLFSSTDKTNIILTNEKFENLGYNLSFDISIELKMLIENKSIILSAKYDNMDFEITVATEKMDDGVKEVIAKIYEYILNQE